MDEQLLKDFIATAQKYNYDWGTVFGKFPELKGYDQQTLKDYVATAEKYNYDYGTVNSKFPEFGFEVKKKESATTELPSADGSLASQGQLPTDFKIKPSQDLPQGMGKPFQIDLSKPAPKRGEKPMFQKVDDYLVGVGSEAIKSVVQTVDDVINSSKNVLKEEGFFDDKTPDTNTTAFDFIKDKVMNATREQLMPGSVLAEGLIKKIINSSLSQEQKNTAIKKLTSASNAAQGLIGDINQLQKENLPEGNIPTEALKAIVGMAPDLILAAETGGASVESRLAKWAEKSTKNAIPFVQKVAPKAAKLLEESVVAPFTKIMAAKGALGEMAKTKEGENVYWNGIKGGAEGALEGMYMHGLGVAAGEVSPKIAKFISKSGLNSAVATAISNPLANAGVFTTARALRTAVVDQKMITPEEAALEAATGVGFSLLHAGSLFKNHKELNHYYDNVLREDPKEGFLNGFGRVLNETKPNLDLAYNPNMKEADVKKLEEARDELRDAILKEPDLNKKQILGSEAIKLQNQIDAFNHVNGIVNNREFIIDEINGNDKLSDEQKNFYINKVNAIADTYDNSEFGTKKRELNLKIEAAQTELDNAGDVFTNLRRPSDIAEAKVAVDEKRAELERLNQEMIDLITNKQKEDAIQKSKASEGLLRTEQPEMELPTVAEGVESKPLEAGKEEVVTAEVPEALETPEVSEEFDGGTRTVWYKNHGYYIKEINGKWYQVGTDSEGNTVKVGDRNIIGIYKGFKSIEDIAEHLKNKTDSELSEKNVSNSLKNVEETKKALYGLLPENISIDNAYDLIDKKSRDKIERKLKTFDSQSVLAEAYHKAKADGSNPELVKAVEDLLGAKPAEEVVTTEKPTEEVSLKTPEETTVALEALPTEDKVNLTFKQEDGTETPVMGNEKMLSDMYHEAINVPESDRTDAQKSAVDIVEVSLKTPKEEAPKEETIIKTQGLSEDELPGYDRMKGEVEGIIEKSKSRGVEPEKILSNVMEYVKGSKVYETATDVQREALVREVNEMFGVKEKKAPSVAKLLGDVKDVKKITSSERVLLKKQIRDLARGARDAKDAIRKAEDEITIAVKKLASSGKITPNQSSNVLRAFSKTNVLSSESVERFMNYMSKVFENAEYADKLKIANKLKSQIIELSNNQKKDPYLRGLGKTFSEIEPSLIDDIDTYSEMASKIKESLEGSKIIKEKVKFADIVNIEDAIKYSNEMKDEQQKKREQYAAEDIEALGIDPADIPYELMKSILSEKEPKITKYQETIIRDALNRAFGLNSSIIKSAMKTGVDAFTGEKVEFTKSQKEVVNKFMDMDLNNLSAKEALQAVDALSNFIQNKSTAKMQDVVSRYQGKQYAKEVFNKGIKAVPLKKYFSRTFGRFLSEQTTTLPQLFERLFKGVERGGYVEDKLGFTSLRNNKSLAQSESNRIVDDYVNKFYKGKANGEAFNSEYNNIERGMSSFMMRNVIGTEAEMKAEFDRRKNLIEESIDALKDGDEKEVAKAKVYQKAYDKVLKDSQSIEDVKKKTDKANLEAVDFWINKWAERYDELADVSLNVYNKILEKDINYNPDRFIKMNRETGEVEISNDESAFHTNNGTMYKKETGVLMSPTRPENLPKNTKNGQVARYIDLGFDKNNSNAMYDALVDIKTAAPIRQVEAFLNSPEFSKIFPTAEDAKILKDRIKLYVSNIRNKNPYSNIDEMSSMIRKLNKVAALGVAQSLGGITQPIKQVIPVAMNTLVNAGSLDLSSAFNADKMAFINRSGQSIANRGVESQAQIESINRLIQKAAESKGEKAMKFIEEANKKWLEIFLVKPDVYIARTSWLTYYEKSLKKQGIDPSKVDYNSHEVNEDAANYATRMVDRQQNISDHDLAGKLFADKNESKQVFVKLFMPFASFRMNQATRLANDMSTLGHWSTSTKEDKITAARSLAGFAVEMASFKAIAGAISLLLGSATKAIMGKDETEEEYEKRKSNILKAQATGTVTDIFSPLPLLDKPVQAGSNYIIDKVQDIANVAQDDKINIYDVKKEDFVKNMGLFGIAAERASQLYDLASLSSGASFKDNYGKENWISQPDQDALRVLIAPALMSNIGLAPSEVSTIIRNAIKDAKQGASDEQGGKTEEQLQFDEEQKQKAEGKKEEAQSERETKIEALTKLRETEYDEKKKDIIDSMIEELSMTDEERKEFRKENKEEKAAESDAYKELLQGYDNKSDMKKYDPELYEKTFGEGSEYYKEHADENEVEKAMKDMLNQKEEQEMNYTKPKKKSRRASWSERSWKYTSKPSETGKSSYKSTSVVRDAEGNIISSSSRRRWQD